MHVDRVPREVRAVRLRYLAPAGQTIYPQITQPFTHVASLSLSLSLLSTGHRGPWRLELNYDPRSHSTSAEVKPLLHYYFLGICQRRYMADNRYGRS